MAYIRVITIKLCKISFINHRLVKNVSRQRCARLNNLKETSYTILSANRFAGAQGGVGERIP